MSDWRRKPGRTRVVVPLGGPAPLGVRGSIFDAMTPAMIERALFVCRFMRRDRPPDPEPGYWLLPARVSGGMRVPACIRVVQTTEEPGLPDNLMDRGAFLAAFVIDKGKEQPVSLAEVWTRRGEPISAGEYRFQIDDRKHARAYRPRDPVGQSAHQKVDWFDVAPPF
jgi:hypothetical protein